MESDGNVESDGGGEDEEYDSNKHQMQLHCPKSVRVSCELSLKVGEEKIGKDEGRDEGKMGWWGMGGKGEGKGKGKGDGGGEGKEMVEGRERG